MAITMEELRRKAKAYDEVREKIALRFGSNVAEEIFSEFEINEDEKVRKAIISGLKYLETELGWDAVGEVDILDIYTWLEKQSKESKVEEAMREVEEKAEAFTAAHQGENADVILAEMRGEIKPKFHEGDWIISNNNKYIYQVVEVKRGIYVVRDNADNREYCVGIESADRDGRLWTILDAKDGDVLYSLDSKQPFIFKHRKPNEQAEVYCGINIYGKFFVENTKDCIITTDKYIPATKEQRDTLFAKMKDAGWEWDAEKKKLRKIDARKNLTLDGDLMQADCMTVEQKPAWREEDEKMLDNCINALGDSSFANTYEIEEWVKSLRQRIGG